MFILRKITNECEQNISLGSSYNVILKSKHQEEFKKMSLSFWKEEEPKNTYGFIYYSGEVLPLMSGDFNYIMSSDGKTFANLTL